MKNEFPFLKASIANRALSVPFVGPETIERERAAKFTARLGANESNFGPSPKAIAAMRSAVDDVWRYADPTSYELRCALADHHGISADNIVVGEGIDGLLGNTCQLALEPGRILVMSDGAYPTMAYHATNYSAQIERVPFKDAREDLDGLLDKARDTQAPLLYVSNPNNPLGTFWRHTELAAFTDAVPETTLLLLDEAYSDTAPPDAVPPLNVDLPNVIRFRTFSKAYGMAGARVGYAIGHKDLIRQYDKVRNHYGINVIGQVGAQAALKDQTYLIQTVRHIAEARNRLEQMTFADGFETLPSATNFLAIDCRSVEMADQIMDDIIASGVFIRRPAVEALQRYLRVTVGTKKALDSFENAWHRAVRD